MAENPTACESLAKVNFVDQEPKRAVVQLVECIRRAVESTYSHKAAASDMNYEPDYWSKVLAGERGIRLGHLALLPIDTQRQIVIRWGSLIGLQIERRGDSQRREAMRKIAEAVAILAEAE